jgi:hypothetical protein
VNRDFLKDAMKALSIKLERDIVDANAKVAAKFATLRQAQAEGKVLAIAIGAHDKGGAQ